MSLKFKLDKDRFTWSPLGGLGEVGMNCMLWGLGEEIVPVDAGILFADTNNFGVDSLFPDFRSIFSKGPVKNWLITHGHEDHIGAVPFVFQLCKRSQIEAPHFWAPPLAASLIELKLKDERYPGLEKYLDHIHRVDLSTWIDFNSYQVRFDKVRHSTPQSCSVALKWKNSKNQELKIMHSSDFKIDLHEFEDGRLHPSQQKEVFLKESPDILFVDSTNSGRAGQSISEQEVQAPLARLIEKAPGRVFVTLFSSNLYRIASIAKIAQEKGRHVCILGRSMQNFHSLGQSEEYYDDCPDFSKEAVLDANQIAQFPPEKQLVLCSGSQGEHRSVLSRLAKGTHPSLHLKEDDTVIFSSKMIPGNEKSISYVVDALLRAGAKVYWGKEAERAAEGPIHASGHGRALEVEEFIRCLEPKTVIPVHGNYHHLHACSEIAKKVLGKESPVYLGVNHSYFSFDYDEEKGTWFCSKEYEPEIPSERFLKFENQIAPSRDPFLKDRKKAALGGVVVVVLGGINSVQVSLRGVLPEEFNMQEKDDELQELKDEVEVWVRSKVKSLEKKGLFSKGNSKQEQDLAFDLERFLRKRVGQRPLVFVESL